MVKTTKANNSHYFKAFNNDYKCGGRYHSLDNSEFRLMVILQSYADGNGIVTMVNGKGYDTNVLCKMVGLNYRTIKRSLLSLIEKKLVRVSEDMTIFLPEFVNDNVFRDTSRVASSKRKAAIQLAKNTEALESIESKIAGGTVVDTKSGEIIERREDRRYAIKQLEGVK